MKVIVFLRLTKTEPMKESIFMFFLPTTFFDSCSFLNWFTFGRLLSDLFSKGPGQQHRICLFPYDLLF